MTRAATMGWLSAAVAVVAIVIVIVDIVHTQSGRSIDHGVPVTRTDEAARSAGASVTPTDPSRQR